MTNFYFGIPWESCSSYIQKVVVKDGVTSIGDYAFYYCGNLTTVELADSVTSIGSKALKP